MSPHLDCYSVGVADISIEDFAVGSTVVILTVLFPYPDGNREIEQTKFQTVVSLSNLGVQQGSRSTRVLLNQSY